MLIMLNTVFKIELAVNSGISEPTDFYAKGIDRYAEELNLLRKLKCKLKCICN